MGVLTWDREVAMLRKTACVVLLLSVGCHARLKQPRQPGQTVKTGNAVTEDLVGLSGGDGSTCERAVVVRGATSASDGIRWEYRWIGEKFPGYKMVSQALIMSNGKVFDELMITTSTGETRSVCFDITEFFGK